MADPVTLSAFWKLFRKTIFFEKTMHVQRCLFPSDSNGNNSNYEKELEILKDYVNNADPETIQCMILKLDEAKEIQEEKKQLQEDKSFLCEMRFKLESTVHKMLTNTDDDQRDELIKVVEPISKLCMQKYGCQPSDSLITVDRVISHIHHLIEKKGEEERLIWTSDDDTNKCIICKDRPRSCAIMPCKHFMYCDVCVSCIDRCSYCRGPIDRVEKFYN
jgi:hypothetical protein